MKPCPQCGTEGTVSVSMKLVAIPLGTSCPGGSTMKAYAEVKAVLECAECDLRVYGHLENAVMRGNAFVGGHFVSERPYAVAA